jgi:hypothetical protein
MKCEIIKNNTANFTGFFKLALIDENNEKVNYDSINEYAKTYLFMSTIKIINTLKKEYKALVVKETVHRWHGYQDLSFAYFYNEEDANKAKDWINSILLSNEIKGVDQLKQEAKNKKEASYEKRVNKKFQQATPFIGKDVIVNIKFSADGVISGDTTMHTKITFIGRVGKDKFVIQTFNGSFYATYSSFYFDENKMTLLNAGQTVKFEIE